MQMSDLTTTGNTHGPCTLKSDICMVCRRLSARVRIKHRTFALLTHASDLIQERLFRPRHTIQMSDLIHAAATSGMGSLSQTFSGCAAGFSLEAGVNVQFALSIRFGYCVSGTLVLTEAHHTNVRLNPRSHYKSNGRFK